MTTATQNRADADQHAPHRAGKRPTVAVVGLGYVGLPTALVLRESGAVVHGIDVSTERIRAISRQDVDLLDADRERLRKALADSRFTMGTRPDAIAAADAVMICVPTPVDRGRAPDLAALESACDAVVSRARPGQTLILTSTSHVGATRQLLIEPLAARGLKSGEDLCVVFSPERIDPGRDDHRQEEVPRVLGGDSARCVDGAAAILGPITPRLHTVSSPEAAELTKLHENAFRAVNIAYANEMADMCGDLGLDPIEIVEAAATKPYGFLPFYPGPGVGGHCIPCDPHYLLASLGDDRRTPLTEAAMREIDERPRRIAGRAREVLERRGVPIEEASVLLVGASYKPGVRDVRESPGVAIIAELSLAGADVHFCDPLVEALSLDGSGDDLDRVDDPASGTWDLVVISGSDPAFDMGWLNGTPVIDCTHRLPAQSGDRRELVS